jgi:hypothetical protein
MMPPCSCTLVAGWVQASLPEVTTTREGRPDKAGTSSRQLSGSGLAAGIPYG